MLDATLMCWMLAQYVGHLSYKLILVLKLDLCLIIGSLSCLVDGPDPKGLQCVRFEGRIGLAQMGQAQKGPGNMSPNGPSPKGLK